MDINLLEKLIIEKIVINVLSLTKEYKTNQFLLLEENNSKIQYFIHSLRIDFGRQDLILSSISFSDENLVQILFNNVTYIFSDNYTAFKIIDNNSQGIRFNKLVQILSGLENLIELQIFKLKDSTNDSLLFIKSNFILAINLSENMENNDNINS
jgi:hypothetical protein